MKLEIYQVGKLPPLTVVECDYVKIDTKSPHTLDCVKDNHIVAQFFTNNIAGFKEVLENESKNKQ